MFGISSIEAVRDIKFSITRNPLQSTIWIHRARRNHLGRIGHTSVTEIGLFPFYVTSTGWMATGTVVSGVDNGEDILGGFEAGAVKLARR